MDREFKHRLEQRLLQVLANYNGEGIRADVLRNQHMNKYSETGGGSSYMLRPREAVDYLTRFINAFCDLYEGCGTASDVCAALASCATYWRTRGRPVAEWEANAIDALLVAFINKFAMTRGMDMGLYTKDIDKDPDLSWEVQAEKPTPEVHGSEPFVMRPIELWTEALPHSNRADRRYVATVEIAPFPDEGMPKVVIWGSRTFCLNPERVQFIDGTPWVYEECFTVVSLTQSPGIPRNKEAEAADKTCTCLPGCISHRHGCPLWKMCL